MMDIARIQVARLCIPLRFSFRHALAERTTSESVLVEVSDGGGRVGYGECAPRAYVTGESADSVSRALQGELAAPFLGRGFDSFEELVAALEAAGRAQARQGLAAFCALELALLDLGGRVFGVSAGHALGPQRRAQARYSGVVPADEPSAVERSCALLRSFGVRDVKAKVGRSREEDLSVLELVREHLGEDVSLRVDANCAWDAPTACRRMREFEAYRIAGLEQPCAAEDLTACARVRRETDVPIILDESLASWSDAQRILDAEACDLFNIRISKCGGLLLSRRLRDLALESGLGCMLGAQVGEAAVLSAAGRCFALCSPELDYVEGSYGTHLLEADLSDEIRLEPGAIGRRLGTLGLGIRVEPDRVRPFLSDEVEVRVGAA